MASRLELQTAVRVYTAAGFPVALSYAIFNKHCTCAAGKNCTNPGKHPIGGIYRATLDAELLCREIEHAEVIPNLVIATGRAPQAGVQSPLVVLDADGEEGRAQLALLEKQYGPLPIGPVVRSGGGGSHYYFLLPNPVPPLIRSLARGILGSHLELKADRSSGVTAPPSIHKSGAHYVWLTDLSTPIPELPSYLWEPYVRESPLIQMGNGTPIDIASITTSTAYGHGALIIACERIAAALPGTQDNTLNLESFNIGNLVGGGEVSYQEAFDALIVAGCQMIPESGKPIWTEQQVAYKVARSLDAGLSSPRSAPPADRPSDPLLEAVHRLNRLTQPVEAPVAQELRRAVTLSHFSAAPGDAPAAQVAAVTHLWGFSVSELASRLIMWKGANFRLVEDRWAQWTGKNWKVDNPVRSGHGPAWGALYTACAHLPELLREELTLAGEGYTRAYEKIHDRLTHTQFMSIVAATGARMCMQADPAHFDDKPLLFNMNNGTYNLETDEFQPHRREDYLCQISPVDYDPEATCPLFDRVMIRCHRETPDNIPYLQRLSGYSLRAGNPAQIFIFLLGKQSRNGKTVFLNAISWVMGSYARPAQGDILYADHKLEEEKLLFDLRHHRMVVFSEPEEGQATRARKVNLPFLKKISGDEDVAIRAHYQQSLSAAILFKLWCGSNHPIQVTESSSAVWERMRVVGFTEYIPPEERVDLKEPLREEGSGIFNWMLAGWRAYCVMGTGETGNAAELKMSLRRDQDPLLEWIEECCERGPDQWQTTAELYDSYRSFAERAKAPVLIRLHFKNRLLATPGISEYHRAESRCLRGLTLKIQPDPLIHFYERHKDE